MTSCLLEDSGTTHLKGQMVEVIASQADLLDRGHVQVTNALSTRDQQAQGHRSESSCTELEQ